MKLSQPIHRLFKKFLSFSFFFSTFEHIKDHMLKFSLIYYALIRAKKNWNVVWIITLEIRWVQNEFIYLFKLPSIHENWEGMSVIKYKTNFYQNSLSTKHTLVISRLDVTLIRVNCSFSMSQQKKVNLNRTF